MPQPVQQDEPQLLLPHPQHPPDFLFFIMERTANTIARAMSTISTTSIKTPGINCTSRIDLFYAVSIL